MWPVVSSFARLRPLGFGAAAFATRPGYYPHNAHSFGWLAEP